MAATAGTACIMAAVDGPGGGNSGDPGRWARPPAGRAEMRSLCRRGMTPRRSPRPVSTHTVPGPAARVWPSRRHLAFPEALSFSEAPSLHGRSSMAYSLGIDLGTTFVTAAVARDGHVEMFPLGDRSTVMHAVVYVSDDGRLVGVDTAARRIVSEPDRVAVNIKRGLGNPTPVLIGGTSHTATALLGALLRDVLTRVTEAEGGEPDAVVLTHPANWGKRRRTLFQDVPERVGLSGFRTVTEPEAAAAHYAATHRLDVGELIAVYDFGGGTLDATVLHRMENGLEVLGAPEGVENLGGVDFDDAVFSYVDFATGGALRRLNMSDPRTEVAVARLRQDCILAKEALSSDTETTIPVLTPGGQQEVRLTREQFEGMIRLPVESTLGALSRTLRMADVTSADLSAVLLVGGSSQIPLIAQMVSQKFGRPAVVYDHPKDAVALGAAILASSRAQVDAA